MTAPAPESLLDSLDVSTTVSALDPLGMIDLVLKFPQQCRDASTLQWHYPPGKTSRHEIKEVVITGLGGSAIGGDFARALSEEYGTVPLVVNRDYTLPHWVGPSTLVLAGSYSGNTEETLSAYSRAAAASAQGAVVTSGGKIKELAMQDGFPVCTVPGGQPPRSATGYMFFPMLKFLAFHHLLHHDFTADIEETLTVLVRQAARLHPNVPVTQNPAKQLAIALQGKIPVIYGSQGYRGAVAYRWKSQFNENTKVAAFANVLPEQNHNEILAWVNARTQANTWAALFLRDPHEQEEAPRIARRVEVTKELVSKSAEVHEIYGEGDSLLARMFSLIYLADFVTVYSAYLQGVCPTNISSIDHLKAELAKIETSEAQK